MRDELNQLGEDTGLPQKIMDNCGFGNGVKMYLEWPKFLHYDVSRADIL